MRNVACDYKPASLNSILFVCEIWKIWILCLGGENVPCWDFPGQLSQLKWYFFFPLFCNKLAKTSVQIFLCRLFSENKKSFWVCHTGCQQSLAVKATESVCFSPSFHGYPRPTSFFLAVEHDSLFLDRNRSRFHSPSTPGRLRATSSSLIWGGSDSEVVLGGAGTH